MADERGAIERVLHLYIDGAAGGDVAKLEEAFHPDARMFGELGGQRLDIPITELFGLSAEQPLDADGSYRATVVSVNQVGDAAVAIVDKDGCWGNVSFTDFFSLSRVGGTWKIVNKTFAHTGGAPPA